jgi:tetratricopeptide (TPR) repeat protein
VIEVLLEAERALTVGLLDRAETLYRQAADADPLNAIAVVGLARVAIERGDDAEGYRQARRALEIDPENVQAARIAARLAEVHAVRGDPLAGSDEPLPAASIPGSAGRQPSPGASASPGAPAPRAASASPGAPAPQDSRSLVDRLLRRNRP